MATDTATVADKADAKGHDHPTEKQYWLTALVLAILTAAEVSTEYLTVFEESFVLKLVFLIVLMIVKFYIVARIFMHLKYDHKSLSLMFMFGILLATVLYMGVLATFHVFNF